jgi:hypothetical protein
VLLALRHIVAKTGSAMKMAYFNVHEKRSAHKCVADFLLIIGKITIDVSVYYAAHTSKEH